MTLLFASTSAKTTSGDNNVSCRSSCSGCLLCCHEAKTLPVCLKDEYSFAVKALHCTVIFCLSPPQRSGLTRVQWRHACRMEDSLLLVSTRTQTDWEWVEQSLSFSCQGKPCHQFGWRGGVTCSCPLLPLRTSVKFPNYFARCKRKLTIRGRCRQRSWVWTVALVAPGKMCVLCLVRQSQKKKRKIQP